MFSTKQLSIEQIATIKQWAEQGAQLADIQRSMRETMGIPVTYMDTRFVVLDLGINLIVEKADEPETEIDPVTPLQTGKTTVTMDSIALPGTIISGRVVFSDGESGIWGLDQTGRPSLDPNTPGYQPCQEDILDFQRQLRSLVESTGL